MTLKIAKQVTKDRALWWSCVLLAGLFLMGMWGFFLSGKNLDFRVNVSGDTSQHADMDSHHAAEAFDRASGTLIGYLSAQPMSDRRYGNSIAGFGRINTSNTLDVDRRNIGTGYFKAYIDGLRIYDLASYKTGIVAVSSLNIPPVARFSTKPTSGTAPLTVNFDGSDSYDLDGKIESYLWDFGDGVHGSGATTSHEFSIGGNYRVTLEVQDNNGAKHTKTTILAIKGVAPLFEETTVFQGGTEGYHTFRIPAIIIAPNDDLLAFAEGWINNRGGSRENKDIVMKRSTNHGQSWSPLQVIVNHKDNFPQYYGYQVAPGNVAPVVDRNTGTIWLPFSRDINKVGGSHTKKVFYSFIEYDWYSLYFIRG